MKDLLESLINKVVDNGTAIQGASEQIRKIPDPAPVLREIDQQVKKQGSALENLGTGLSELKTRMTGLTRQVAIPKAEMALLQGTLESHARLFEKALQKTVHYQHFLGRSLYVLVILSVITMGMGCLFFMEWQIARRHAENDIQWRDLKNMSDIQLERAVDSINAGWLASPERFETNVRYEENRQEPLYRTQQLLHENQQEIEKLERMKKDP